ncbi:MAG: hypothetical protein PUF31_00550 [Oscillospiraceae bacterium]|nr:hypothetical protein [Oscillospiraceae bacterium]
MLKRIYILLGVVLISLSLYACSSINSSNNDAHTDMASEDNTTVESFSRAVDYEINDNVMEILHLDNETIELLDYLYIAANEAYEDLSAQKFYTTVYDALIAFETKFQDTISKVLENPADENKQFFLEASDVSTNSIAATTAGYNYSAGKISIENAAFDILIATDSILSYMYQNYVPIFQPRVINSDSIFKMYEENELSAEKELKNQLLCVSGTVYEVTQDLFDKPYIGLATSKGMSYELLRCYTHSNPSEDILSLRKGDKVTCVIQITNKDTFDINAKLWNVALLDEAINANSIETSQVTSNNELIDTEYYTLEIPSNWNGKYSYNIIENDHYNYTLNFYHKQSKEDNFGGELFSIHLLTEYDEYRYWPSYDVLGSLEVYRIGSYNIVVTYPTDAQCPDSADREYKSMTNDIQGILTTISYKNDCTFSKTPLKVDDSLQ